MKETKAKLNKEKNKFNLLLVDEKEADKLLLSDDKTSQLLEELSDILGYSSVEVMLQNAQVGDEKFLDIEREFENGKPFDMQHIEDNLNKFKSDIPAESSQALEEELLSNYQSDLAASAIESIYEDFVYRVLSLMQELVIGKLIISSNEMKEQHRLITIISKHAPLVDIQVVLEEE